VESKLDFLVKEQESNSNKLEGIGNDLRKGFIELALRNEELLKSNHQLKQQLDEILKGLSTIKQERDEKAAHARRKRDPMTARIYTRLIRTAEGPAYTDVRLRIAIYLLTITRIRIKELLSLKVDQLQTLLESHWLGIDRSKRGPANHKAFLTKEGKKLVKDHQKDFQFIFLMEEADSYVFTDKFNHSKILNINP